MPRDSDKAAYQIFTGRQNCDKALQSLDGILEGISLDGTIDAEEQGELRRWIQEHIAARHHHPLLHDAIGAIERALSDGEVTLDEIAEIRDVCGRQHAARYYDDATHTMQRLHGLLHGILADGKLTPEEVAGLEQWLGDNYGIREFWPVSEIETLVVKAMQDRTLSVEEATELTNFLLDFTQVATAGDSTRLRTVRGICATDPEIVFPGSRFCITGRSERAGRREIVDHIEHRGGIWHNGISPETRYLIVCAEANACWAYATYGRKVVDAVRLREEGKPLVIVHERDFWDAIVN